MLDFLPMDLACGWRFNLLSIGVNSGLLPTKGLTLPLMSYGGSSVLVNCIVIAVLLRIDHENRLAALGIR